MPTFFLGIKGLKHIIWILLGSILVINGVLDFWSMSQLADSIQSGEDVKRSYNLVLSLNRSALLAQKVQFSVLRKRPIEAQQGYLDLQKAMIEIETLVADRPEFLPDFQVMKTALPGLNKSNFEAHLRFSRAANRLQFLEEENLRQRNLLDQEQNRKAQRSISQGISMDFIFILAALAFYGFDNMHRKALEKALHQTIRNVSEANRTLDQASQRKSDLLRSTVHDLKNPIGCIMGFADLIQTESDNRQSVAEMSDRIQKISQNTLDLVNSLLESSAADFSARESVDLLSVVWENILMSEAPARIKNQDLVVSADKEPLMVEGDRQKLSEIVQNLISNSIKYSPLGLPIEVRCFRVDGYACFEVLDRGPGFTPEDLEKAGQKFQKLSAQPTGGESSSGLGLSIVKEYVEFHKGRLHINNGPSGMGAHIQVFFPISKNADARSRSRPLDEGPG